MNSIMFDLDGVLADFVLGFLSIAKTFDDSVDIHDSSRQKTWNFKLPDEIVEQVFARIKASPSFWLSLNPLVSRDTFERINQLNKKGVVYFVTNRQNGINTHWQTVQWLELQGIISPTVVVSGLKGQFAVAVAAQASIDDKAGNAVYIGYESPKTRSFILDRPHNRFDHQVLGGKVVRVYSVEEFLDIVESE